MAPGFTYNPRPNTITSAILNKIYDADRCTVADIHNTLIAKAKGYSRNAFSTSIRRLIDAGYVEFDGNGHCSHCGDNSVIYRITLEGVRFVEGGGRV